MPIMSLGTVGGINGSGPTEIHALWKGSGGMGLEGGLGIGLCPKHQ